MDDRAARQKAWDSIVARYSAQEGRLLSDKEVLRRYQADQRGEDWRSAPKPKTSLRNKVLKGGALAALSPLMFVSPRLTMRALESIDHKLTDDVVPPLRPVTTQDPAPPPEAPAGTRTIAPPPALKACPECAEMIQPAARICRFCRYEFPT